MMLEGLDRMDPYLMLEASKEFDKSVKDTAKIAQNFLQALENGVKTSKSDSNMMMEDLVKSVRNLVKQLSSVKTDKVPDKFSFKAATDMRDAKSDNAIAEITMAAAQLDVIFNGTRDGIIAIAEVLEKLPMFSVGGNGILISQEFNVSEGEPEDQISLSDLMYLDPEMAANKLAGTTDDGWKEKFGKIFDAFAKANNLDLSKPEDKKKVEEETLKSFGDLAKALEDGTKKAVQNLGKIEPNEGLKKATEETPFFKTLLKSNNPYNAGPKLGRTIIDGLIGVSLKGLFTLTQDLISMAKDVNAVITDAAKRTAEAAESQDPDKAPKASKNLHAKLVKIKGIKPEIASQIIALGEEYGYNLEKEENFSNCKKQEELAEKLKKLLGEGETLDSVMDIVDIKVKGEDETDDPNKVDQLVDQKYLDYKEKSDFEVQDALIEIVEAWVEQLSDRQKEVWKENNGPEFIDALYYSGEDGPDPDKARKAAEEWVQANKLDDPKSPLGNDKKFSPNELNRLADMVPEIVEKLMSFKSGGTDEPAGTIGDSLYRRWGVLAGIIKG